MPRTFPNFWQAVVIILICLAAQIGYGVIVEIAGRIFHVELLSSHPTVLSIGNLIIFTAAIFFFCWKTRCTVRQLLPISSLSPVLFIAVTLCSLGAAILLSDMDNLFRFFFPVPEFIVKVFSNLASSEHLVASLFCLAVMAPLTEEFFFRGVILTSFSNQYSPRKALLLSAVLFAFMHVNPWQLTSTLTLGILLGWYFQRTNNLTPCLLGHAINNALAATIPLLSLDIPGFSSPSYDTTVQFQPLWLNFTGGTLLALGLYLFHRHAVITNLPPLPTSAPTETPPIISDWRQ